MSAAQLQAELDALLEELECIDMPRLERSEITARIRRMMPEQAA